MHLQRFTAVLLAVGLLFGFTGCKDEQELSPELTITPNIVEASAQGGSLSVSYSIKNPVEGEEISASCEESWIAGLSQSESEITFTVAANKKNEKRFAVVTVDYAGAASAATFTVRQAAASEEKDPEKPGKPEKPEYDMTRDLFDIEISGITQMDVQIRIIPEDPSITYFAFHRLTENFDTNESDDDLFQGDMAWLQTWADAYGVTLKELMKNSLLQGEYNGSLEGLTSNTSYTYWVYGIYSETLERTTKITKVTFKTLEPVMSGAEIEITPVLEGDQLTVTFDPGDFEGYYYANIQMTCNPEFDMDIEKRELENTYLNHMSNMRDYYDKTREEMLEDFGHQGICKLTKTVEKDRCYLLGALTFDDQTFAVTSEVFLTGYYNGEYEKFVLDLQPKNISGQNAHVKVTPNKPEQPYVTVIFPSEQIQDWNDNKILREICMIPAEEQKVYTGMQDLKFSGLTKNTEYTVCGAAFDEEFGWIASGLSKTTFTTTDGNSENEPLIIDITASEITETGAKVTFTPNREKEEYTYMIFTANEFRSMSESEVIEKMIASENLNVQRGKHTCTYDQLTPLTSYVVCGIGYDTAAQKPDFDLNMVEFKTLGAAFEVDITASEITSTTAKVTYTPNDIEADYSIMLLSADEIADMTDQEIIDLMVELDNINTHHDVYIRTYDELKPGTVYYACSVQFDWDTLSAISGLFKCRFTTSK